jgi:two-component system response regulator MprA
MSELILVVEDDGAINQLLVQTLADDGFTLRSAAHGREALDILETERPAAIVLDLNMPVMDGRTFMRHLRNDSRDDVRDIPVLVLSAQRIVQERAELGVQASITKPFDFDSVTRTLDQLLRGRIAAPGRAISA